MENRYAGPCSVCKAMVEPGEGFLTREARRWIVTHYGPCPSGEDRSNHAQELITATSRILADRSSPRARVRHAIEEIGRLAATGWVRAEECEAAILAAPASRKLDRIEIAELLERHLGGVST